LFFAKCPANTQTIRTGQPDIKNNQVLLAGKSLPHTLVSVIGNGDFEIIVPKVQGKQLGDVMLVFDNQDFALSDVADVNSDLSCWCKVQLSRLYLRA